MTTQTGLLLRVLPVAYNLFFTLLARGFDYPDILRQPTGQVLERLAAGGSRLVLEPHCSFCGTVTGPFSEIEGLFTVLIRIPCLEVRLAQPDTLLGLHDPGQPGSLGWW